MLALRLTPETESRLDHIAKITGRSKHFYATEAVETHLQALEGKYLSVDERAKVQALVDFDRIELALVGDLDPDLLSAAEQEHYLDATLEQTGAPSKSVEEFYQALGNRPGACGTDDNGQLVWRHPDGSIKPYPPT